MSDENEEAPPELEHPPLVDTGNGPTASYEEVLLHAEFGDPDENGVYGVRS